MIISIQTALLFVVLTRTSFVRTIKGFWKAITVRILKMAAPEANFIHVKRKTRQSNLFSAPKRCLKRLMFATRNTCPGDPSKIQCCVLDARSPLSPANLEEPPEPILSYGGGSGFSMLPDPWPSSQEESELIQTNFEPPGNFYANALPEDAQDISFTSSPSFGQSFDLGLFDVASLPATEGNEFTAFLDADQFSPEGFSGEESMLALALDGEENLWSSDFTPIS